jgi:hypothetical protein
MYYILRTLSYAIPYLNVSLYFFGSDWDSGSAIIQKFKIYFILFYYILTLTRISVPTYILVLFLCYHIIST